MEVISLIITSVVNVLAFIWGVYWKISLALLVFGLLKSFGPKFMQSSDSTSAGAWAFIWFLWPVILPMVFCQWIERKNNELDEKENKPSAE